jgi:hypothetical protein
MARHVHHPSDAIRVSAKEVKDAKLDKGGAAMKRKSMLTIATTTVVLAVLGAGAISAQDKYTVKRDYVFTDYGKR